MIIVDPVYYHLCIAIIPWKDVKAPITSHFIVVDQCPCVRPIGIAGTLRRLLGKTICKANHIDLNMGCCSDQVCSSLLMLWKLFIT